MYNHEFCIDVCLKLLLKIKRLEALRIYEHLMKLIHTKILGRRMLKKEVFQQV